MDLWEAIKQDHEKLDALFEKLLEEEGESDGLVQQLIQELEAHTEGEEKAIYPELRKIDALKELIAHGIEEHGEIGKMLQQLAEADEDERAELIERLQEAVLDHVEEEEEDVIPVAQDEVTKLQAEEMLKGFQKAKQAVLSKSK